MKYAKAILATFAVGLLLDILIDATIPDRVMNLVFVLVASVVLLGILLVFVGTVRRNRWGINRACELPRLRFSDAASAATEISEASALGWLDVCEMWLRSGQMGSLDYPNKLVVGGWEQPYRLPDKSGANVKKCLRRLTMRRAGPYRQFPAYRPDQA